VAYLSADRLDGQKPVTAVVAIMNPTNRQTPGLDGFAAAFRPRAEPPTATIRLIAATWYGREADAERAREARFNDHLVKPANPERLLVKLAE
jgi:CheY-like chemotaxis protein